LKKEKRRIFKIRWQLLLILLPVSILPVLVIVTVIMNSLYHQLNEKTRLQYQTLLTQVGYNLDFIFDQNARSIVNIFSIPEITEGLNAPPYQSMREEEDVSTLVAGNEKKQGLRDAAQEKFDGAVFLYEMDRVSLIDKKRYKIHYGFDTSYFISPPDYDKLITDPLFKLLENDNSIRLQLGKLQNGVIPGLGGDEKPVLLYPWYDKPPADETDTFTKFLLVILHIDVLPDVYQDINALQFGTLYILDKFNNVLVSNHPSIDDDFAYDMETGRYVPDEDYDDSESLMSFDDYALLNTDTGILQTPQVTRLLTMLKLENSTEPTEFPESGSSITDSINIVRYNGVSYLAIISHAESADCHLVYFLPQDIIFRPFYSLLRIILIMTVAVIFIVSILSVFLSMYITRPIEFLTSAAIENARGAYRLVDVSSNNEIGELAANFNKMVREIRGMIENSEHIIKKRTVQLEEAKAKAEEANLLKSKFLANISHEIRTPINIITGNISLLQFGAFEKYNEIMDELEHCSEEIDAYLEKSSRSDPQLTTFKTDIDAVIDVLNLNVTMRRYIFQKLQQDIAEGDAEWLTASREHMNSVLSLIDREEEENYQAYEYINKASEFLINLINRILDLSKAEIGKFEVHLEYVVAVEFFNLLLMDAQSYCISRGKDSLISITQTIDGMIPDKLFTDKNIIHEVFLNFISNAIKFTPQG
jgi:signal transduction histidine kinase